VCLGFQAVAGRACKLDVAGWRLFVEALPRPPERGVTVLRKDAMACPPQGVIRCVSQAGAHVPGTGGCCRTCGLTRPPAPKLGPTWRPSLGQVGGGGAWRGVQQGGRLAVAHIATLIRLGKWAGHVVSYASILARSCSRLFQTHSWVLAGSNAL
jgi:hypothetical protein